MQQIWQTLDGETFTDSFEAEKHERQILSQVKMWDWDKESTTDTSRARLVYLSGDKAGAIFAAMIDANDKEYAPLNTDQIDTDDTGWFYWDDFEDCYRYIDDSIVNILIAANHQI